MEPQVSGSFIPKKALTSERRGGLGLFFLISLLFFILSIVAAGAAFGYKGLLGKALADKKDSLQKYQDAYDIGSVEDLLRFDSRIKQAGTLLGKHVAPSALFTFLSEETLAAVQFTNFEFNLNQDGSGKLVLTGIADSFSSVALQSDQFGASKVLRDVVFSGITVGLKGVEFTVNATVDPSLILYGRNLVTQAQTP